MRIAMIGRYYNRQGGTSRCLAALSDHAARQHEVDVYAHEILDADGSQAHFVRVPMLHRPSVLQTPTFARATAARIDRVDYDVVHSHENGPAGADIFTAHSCYAAWLRQRRADAGLLGVASRLYPPHELRLALSRRGARNDRSLILAVSQTVKAELERELAVDPRRVRVLHNGTDTAQFHPAASREQAFGELDEPELRDAAGAVVLLFAAYEFRKRGLAQVIRALARLRDAGVELWVLGKDDPQPYRRLARACGVERQVRFLGHKARVQPYFRAADAFVLPTEYEAFGLVILEALACAAPVITSRRAGAAELMTHGRQGWLLDDPQDVEELVAALTRFLAERDRWPALGAAARDLAERQDWAAVWKRLAPIYEQVAAGTRAGHRAWQCV